MLQVRWEGLSRGGGTVSWVLECVESVEKRTEKHQFMHSSSPRRNRGQRLCVFVAREGTGGQEDPSIHCHLQEEKFELLQKQQ